MELSSLLFFIFFTVFLFDGGDWQSGWECWVVAESHWQSWEQLSLHESESALQRLCKGKKEDLCQPWPSNLIFILASGFPNWSCCETFIPDMNLSLCLSHNQTQVVLISPCPIEPLLLTFSFCVAVQTEGFYTLYFPSVSPITSTFAPVSLLSKFLSSF